MGHTLLSQDEKALLDSLASYGLLDSAPEPAFDELTRLVAQVCNTNIALIVLVDADLVCFKSCYGIAAAQLALDASFCECTRLLSDVLVVPDALKDERFIKNPWVAGAPHMRFYAGVPLFTPEGQILGTLCVMDRTPRDFPPEQRAALWILSRQVMAQFELRRRTLEHESAESRARENEALLRTVIDTVPQHIFAKDRDGRVLFINRTAAASLGSTPDILTGLLLRDFHGVKSESDGFSFDDIQVIDSGVAKFIPEETITLPNQQKRIF